MDKHTSSDEPGMGGVPRTPKHRHKWHLAKYTDSYLIPVGEGVQHYTPPHAFFVCECGSSKGVDVLAGSEPQLAHPKGESLNLEGEK